MHSDKLRRLKSRSRKYKIDSLKGLKSTSQSKRNADSEYIEMQEINGDDKDEQIFGRCIFITIISYYKISIQFYLIIVLIVNLFLVSEHEKPIPVSEFSNHVDSLHEDRDRMLEIEYKVSNN